MSRRRSFIPQRKRIFLGCEGESEQSYGSLLQKLADQREDLHLFLDVVLLKGGGDPLGYVEIACRKIQERERKRDGYLVRTVLIDNDRFGQDPERDRQIVPLAATHDLRIIWQDTCHEAFLLRHLTGCQHLRPPTTPVAMRELIKNWAEYRKPMTALRLAQRIQEPEVRAAATVEPEFDDFLKAIAFI
jgi:hypothetical protein